MNPINDIFAGMDDLDSAPTRTTAPAAETIKCIRCCGSGKVRYGYVNVTYYNCSTCKGTGRVTQQRLNRVAGAKKAEVTRVQNVAAKKALFIELNPDVWAWLNARAAVFPFAASLLESVHSYGCLTEKQLAAAQKCIVGAAARQVERKQAEVARSVDVDASAILAALNKAASSGLKRPKLLTEALTFALAGASSRNPGCVYVTTPDDLYLGKITPAGVFAPSRDCSDEAKAKVVAIAGDVLGAAVLFGKQTGRCSCCNRELTDPVSVANGIGPICASRFF